MYGVLSNLMPMASASFSSSSKSPLINHLNNLNGRRGNPKPSPARGENFVVRETVREFYSDSSRGNHIYHPIG
jgi:hypothetical protein